MSIIERRILAGEFLPFVVSDSLHHVPERATIVAMYKRLVVGCAILSSPVETYITYLAVRAGWENAQIATYVYPFFDLKIIDTKSLQCYAVSSHRLQSKQRHYSTRICE